MTEPALAGQVALITGGGSGIGRAVAERFLLEGCRVVVLERSREAASALRVRWPDIAVVTGDATRSGDVEEAVEVAVHTFGHLDTLVANAGRYDLHRTLRSLSIEEMLSGFDELFAINVKASLLAARHCLDPLRESGGSIIFTVSPAGFEAACGGVLYTASKHALVGVVRQLAYELAPTVRVNGVAPGATHTNLQGIDTLRGTGRPLPNDDELAIAATPLARVAEPEDHAGAYVLLASRRDGCSITASIIRTDGGMDVPVRPHRSPTQQASHARS